MAANRITLTAYRGRDHEVVRELLADGEPLIESQYQGITDVQLHVNGTCLKESEGQITREDGVIRVRLGNHLTETGTTTGYLTVFDVEKTNGAPWEEWRIRVVDWPVCD